MSRRCNHQSNSFRRERIFDPFCNELKLRCSLLVNSERQIKVNGPLTALLTLTGQIQRTTINCSVSDFVGAHYRAALHVVTKLQCNVACFIFCQSFVFLRKRSGSHRSC